MNDIPQFTRTHTMIETRAGAEAAALQRAAPDAAGQGVHGGDGDLLVLPRRQPAPAADAPAARRSARSDLPREARAPAGQRAFPAAVFAG